MKNITLTILIIFTSNSFAKVLDQAIVIIENDVITQSEYQNKLKFIIDQYRLAGNPLPNDLEAFRQKILDQMVNTRLQMNYAKKNGLEVKEWMVDKAMEDVAQKSEVTLSEFREKMIQNGINYNTYRNVIKQELVTREVQRRIVSERIKISKKEIEDFLKHKSHIFKENNQYKISNILISLPETPTISEKMDAKNKIKMVRDKFNNGEEFSSLAKSYSDSGNSMSGGGLGWRKISEVPKIFLEDLEILNKGEISKIIETINGFYIFYLEDKKEMGNIQIEERKARHILIKKNALITDDIAKSKLLEIKLRIINGERFSDLARAYSDDTMSAADGGTLNWAASGTFVPEFDDKIDNLPLNKVSEPFSSQFGWHIIEVLGKRKQDNTEIVKRNLARKYLTSSRSNEVLDSWVIELKEFNYIKYISENSNKSRNSILNKKNYIKKQWDPFSE
ncbi:peptidylprolyl isomerase [Gammaproteobacteria bacterium]|nr:peptidylprolyl isomerase [Gammaproteobacteria bacterium]